MVRQHEGLPLKVEGIATGVPIPVSVSGGGGTTDVNLIQVGGAAVALGQTTMAASLPVTIASNQTAVPISGTVAATQSTSPWVVGQATGTNLHVVTDATSTTIATQGTATNLKTQAEVFQGGTAVGAAAPLQVSLANTGANGTAVAVSVASIPTHAVTQGTTPWIVAGGGTAGTAATGVVSVQGIASMTPVQVSQATASNLNATVVQATGTNLHVVTDTTSTTAVTQATASNLNAQVVGAVASAGSNAGNPVKVAGVFNTAQPTVTNGQIVDAQSTNRGARIVATGADTFNVTVNAALPAGAAVIGHVITDTGSTTAVTQATASNLNAQVVGAAASGASKAGNPVQVGGVFNTTQPTVTNGQAVEVQSTARGAQIVATGTDTFNVTVNAALPTGTNTIGNVGTGKTLKTKTGSASATFTIVAAVTSKKIKVYSLSLMTASTTAVTVTFKDGAAGTAVGTYILQAITGTNFGITENLAVPSQLFETSAGVLLEMAFSAAQTVTYNLRYWDDDAT